MKKPPSEIYELQCEHKSKEYIRKDKQCINYSEEFYPKKSVSTLTLKHACGSITPLKHDPGNDSLQKALHLSWCIHRSNPPSSQASFSPFTHLSASPPLSLNKHRHADGHKHGQQGSEGPPDLPRPR